MTREAVGTVSVPRDNARSERVCGGVSAAIEKGLVYAAAILTFAVLLFLIGYILVTGIPHLTPSLFSLHYTSENVSMIPAIVTTVEMTALALLLAVPLGLFTAIYLNEYAENKRMVAVIEYAAETLSGIPSIVYGLFGMLFFVTRLHWGYSLIAGAMTLAIMILPLIMRTAEEALMSVPDSFREGSFGLGAGRLRTVFRIVLRAGHPVGHHPQHRPHRRRDRRAHLHRRHHGADPRPHPVRPHARHPYVCALRRGTAHERGQRDRRRTAHRRAADERAVRLCGAKADQKVI